MPDLVMTAASAYFMAPILVQLLIHFNFSCMQCYLSLRGQTTLKRANYASNADWKSYWYDGFDRASCGLIISGYYDFGQLSKTYGSYRGKEVKE